MNTYTHPKTGQTLRKQQLLKKKIGEELLPKVREALEKEITDIELTVTFGVGSFQIDFNWTPPEHLYSKRGRLDITNAIRLQEEARSALARRVRQAMIDHDLEYVKTYTRSPNSYVAILEGGEGKAYIDPHKKDEENA